MCLNIKKVTAFTLAETLIVMGIIGVVSALTLPNLNSSTGEKEKIAKVKKIYQNLNEALDRAQVVYGPYYEWGGSTTRFGERMTEFMRVSKNCKETNNTGCFPKSTSRSDVNDSGIDAAGAYKFITADGQSVAIQRNSNIVGFWVDINGPNKGSHKFSKDIFFFILRSKNDGIIPGDRPSTFSSYFTNKDSITTPAARWIIEFDNMDYLNADNTGKCKNGTVMNETNPRCK